jgi:hypothetical protein
MLLFTCFVTPFRLAFYLNADDTFTWKLINWIVDGSFSVDMILLFFTCITDEENGVIDDRNLIARKYITGWFFIDFMSVFPFDMLKLNSDYTGLIRIFRISKIYKIVKVARLIKIFKMFKQRQQVSKSVEKVVKLPEGVERLMFFVLLFVISLHIFTCLWILITQIDATVISWIIYSKFEHESNAEKYVASMYFVATTFTTVGFGDIRAYNIGERIFCIQLMFIGVMGFSFASGALSSILTSMERTQARLKEKKEVLDRMRQQYHIPDYLYMHIYKNFEHDEKKDLAEETQFLEQLNANLRIEVAMLIYKEKYDSIKFFSRQLYDGNFIGWVCSLLKPMMIVKNEFIFQEGDSVVCIYFMDAGQAEYVMRSHNNFICVPYYTIDEGDHFGEIDIVFAVTQSIQENEEKETKHHFSHNFQGIYRRFTVQATKPCSLLTLSTENLFKMQYEFVDQFDEIFRDGEKRLIDASSKKYLAMVNN